MLSKWLVGQGWNSVFHESIFVLRHSFLKLFAKNFVNSKFQMVTHVEENDDMFGLFVRFFFIFGSFEQYWSKWNGYNHSQTVKRGLVGSKREAELLIFANTSTTRHLHISKRASKRALATPSGLKKPLRLEREESCVKKSIAFIKKC